MGNCQPNNENIEKANGVIKKENYDEFRKNYKKLNQKERLNLKKLNTNSNYTKFIDRYEKEIERSECYINFLLGLFVFIGIVLFYIAYRQKMNNIYKTLTRNPMEYLLEMPYPIDIDYPPLLNWETTKQLSKIMKDSLLTYYYSIISDKFSKAHEMMKIGLTCAIFNLDHTSRVHFYEVKKLLIKEDYYLKLSEIKIEGGIPNFDINVYIVDTVDIMKITKYLDFVSNCYLTTRNETYLNILERFVNSSNEIVSDTAKLPFESFTKNVTGCEK
jgi:hypothetical protein